MKSLPWLRQSLAMVAVIVLAACNAGQNVPSNVAGPNSGLRRTSITFDHRRKFTAAYSGTYSKSGDCSLTAMLIYKGQGKAKFLHSSNEQLSLILYCGSRGLTGAATLTSVQRPRDTIAASVTSSDFKSPCNGFTMSFTVTGGTGRFRRATGGGSIVLNALSSKCSSYSYSDKWSGTLKF